MRPAELGDPVGIMEGVEGINEGIEFLKNQKPLEPLAWRIEYMYAARDHVQDIGPKGLVQHEGTDGSQPWQRTLRYCERGAGEVVSFGNTVAIEVIIQLFMDDNLPTRGHRLGIFNEASRFMGSYTGPHSKYKSCTVIDLSAP